MDKKDIQEIIKEVNNFLSRKASKKEIYGKIVLNINEGIVKSTNIEYSIK